MNRGVLQSSPVQQMTSTTGGNPNYWWSMNNNISRPPPPPQHTSFSAPPPPLLPPPPDHYTPVPLPPYFSNLWVDNIQELPPESISWSQLLLGGLVDENDKSDMNNILQRKKGMENWEEHLLNQHSNGSLSHEVRQEYITKSYICYGNDSEEYDQRVAKSSWLPMPPAVSPPSSCITTLNSNKLVDLSGKKLDGNGRHPPPDHSSECNSIGATARATKKARVQPSSTQSAFKVRKEKLGDRITALHQLVSPFGKTDTASVLFEAIGYITFLQTQIQALSVPYLGNTSGKMRLRHQQQNESYEEHKKDLKGKGLCLVPISSTLQVENDNGADYWAPALGGSGGCAGGSF